MDIYKFYGSNWIWSFQIKFEVFERRTEKRSGFTTWNYFDNVMTKFRINNSTDARQTDVNLLIHNDRARSAWKSAKFQSCFSRQKCTFWFKSLQTSRPFVTYIVLRHSTIALSLHSRIYRCVRVRLRSFKISKEFPCWVAKFALYVMQQEFCKQVKFLFGYLFPLHLTSVSCHVTVYFQRVSIVLRVDPVLAVSFRIPRVPDVFTGMSRIMRIPTFCFDWKQKEILIFSSRRRNKTLLNFEMCWKQRL